MLPAHLRPFVDFIFQFAEPQIAVRKTLYTHFTAGFTKDFDDFSRIVDRATDGFDCLVISLKSRSKYLDQIFLWYHVDDLERAAAVSLPALLPPDDVDDDDEVYRIIDISSSRKKDETAPDRCGGRCRSPTGLVATLNSTPATSSLISPTAQENLFGPKSATGSYRSRQFIRSGKPLDGLVPSRI